MLTSLSASRVALIVSNKLKELKKKKKKIEKKKGTILEEVGVQEYAW